MKNESIAVQYRINIPEDATNGDVIKMMFPFVTKYITHNEHNIYIDSPIQACVYTFDRYWWNAPYKVESEDKE